MGTNYYAVKRNHVYTIEKYILENQVLGGYFYLKIMMNFTHFHNLKNG